MVGTDVPGGGGRGRLYLTLHHHHLHDAALRWAVVEVEEEGDCT